MKPPKLTAFLLLMFMMACPLLANTNELVPNIPAWQARWELARVLSYAKRYDESISQYRKLLAEKPDLLEAKIELANVLSWSGKNQEALDFLKNIGTNYLNTTNQILLADLYASNKDYDRALPIYQNILKNDPKNRIVRFKLAELLSWNKDYDQALKEYETLLADTPNDIQLRRRYAQVLFWAGRNDEAAAELQKTLPEAEGQ